MTITYVICGDIGKRTIFQLFTFYCSEDDFTVEGRDVGRVKGVEIYRDTSGWEDGWHLDSVSYLAKFIKWGKFPYIHFLTIIDLTTEGREARTLSDEMLLLF